jgi:hypothetical protein
MWIAVQKWGSPSMSFWSFLDVFTTCYTIFKQCQNAIHTGYSQSNILFYRSASMVMESRTYSAPHTQPQQHLKWVSVMHASYEYTYCCSQWGLFKQKWLSYSKTPQLEKL